MITVETRRDSHTTIKPKKQLRANEILEILSQGNFTASEITQKLLDKGIIKQYDRNCVSPRLTELSQQGLVKAIDKTYCPITGRTVAVWKLVQG